MTHRTPTLISCLRLGRMAEAEVTRSLTETGLDATGYLLLTLLDEEGPADSAAALAQMAGLSKQAAQQALERLSLQHVVAGYRSCDDRRATEWHLEPEGQFRLDCARSFLECVEARLRRQAPDAGAIDRLRFALDEPIRLAGYDA